MSNTTRYAGLTTWDPYGTDANVEGRAFVSGLAGNEATSNIQKIDAALEDCAYFRGTCSTAGASAAKTITGITGWSLTVSNKITVYFSNNNTANNPTLNVNNTGAKAIWASGAAISANMLKSGVYNLYYDGLHFILLNPDYSTVSLDGGTF